MEMYIKRTSGAEEAIYSLDFDFHGTDRFTYQVSNGELTSSGTITVRVKSVDDAPIAHRTHLMTYENTIITFDLSNIVSDIDSEDLIFTIELIPSNGLIEL